MSLASQQPIAISSTDFDVMLKFSRTIDALQSKPLYIGRIHALPEVAQHISAHPSLLMGFDFHLTPDGPKLIEINNNAGGLFDIQDGWIPQREHEEMQGDLRQRLLSMFPRSWQHIAIMDEDISTQYMLPEMQAYADLLRSDGRKVSLLNPADIKSDENFLYGDGHKIDAIYNRHTDFYLESKVLSHIRDAFLSNHVVLNPYPRSYALIGDKNRMVDWWRPGFFDDVLGEGELASVQSVVPETHLLSEMNIDTAWSSRKHWVFKPAARHGGKGVLMGKSISRTRFDAMDQTETVAQQLVPPSIITINDKSFKFDIRLYMCGQNLVAMAGRAWNGQITNFQEDGSGWTSIQVRT